MGLNPISSTKKKIRVNSKEDNTTVVKSPACAKADSTDENFTIVKRFAGGRSPKINMMARWCNGNSISLSR